ncbi:hypothetical protein [Paracoccus sp. TOH]|uniref:hypothetical protein n=1 Tax=Paracoccus sp. TOH TaxID=1263728 RepID=UPI0025AFFE58|nr:hypothetical protein [Paracoccus sp. TOH]WJS86333.1 sulfotransferase [Paracoccus sp. TOH]
MNSIDGYCIRGENGGVLSHISRAYHDLQDSSPIWGLKASSKASPGDHPWFGGERIDATAFGKSMCKAFVDNILSLPSGTRVGGFKEIRYHTLGEYLDRHLEFISHFFPNSRFIFNRRNLESVARSGWWKEQDTKEVIRKLGAADLRFERYVSAHRGSSMLMEYDDYKDDPAALKPLYNFIGEKFEYQTVSDVLKKKLTHLQSPH